MSPSQHKYWRGVVLYSICEFLEIDKGDYELVSRKIHNALKKMFDIKSFAGLESKEFEKIASITRMLFLRQYGWIIPEANEHGLDIANITMKEFLKHKNLI